VELPEFSDGLSMRLCRELPRIGQLEVKKATLTHALARKLEQTKTNPASFVVEPSPHVTEADRQVRIPEDSAPELQRLTKR
jgi:hypothetical protein